MKMVRGSKESGQSMLPILLTAAAIMTTLIIATSGLTGGARSAKTAQMSVENEMLSNAVYQIINSENACHNMIINGDNNRVTHGGPIPFPSNGLAPVYQFKNGLTFDPNGAQPFLTYTDRINTLVIPSPVGLTTNQSSLRLDPTGFINYGLQPTSGQSNFAGTNCYLMNLHVEPLSPSSVYGNTTHKFDFPIYIGVNSSYNITACQGATAGSPCIAANPVVNPSPNPTCATPGVPVNIGWVDTSAAYVTLVGPGYTTTTLTGTTAAVTPPSPVPSNGIYVYTLTPYSTAGTAGSSVYIDVAAEMVPGAPTAANISSASVMSWTGDAYTNFMSVYPYPGPSEAPTMSLLPVPFPSPFEVFTFTPSNNCGDVGPSVTRTFSPSPSPSPTTTPSPPASSSPSPTASPTTSPSPGGSPSPSPSVHTCTGAGLPMPSWNNPAAYCQMQCTPLAPSTLADTTCCSNQDPLSGCSNCASGAGFAFGYVCPAAPAPSPSVVSSPSPSPSGGEACYTVVPCTCGGTVITSGLSGGFTCPAITPYCVVNTPPQPFGDCSNPVGDPCYANPTGTFTFTGTCSGAAPSPSPSVVTSPSPIPSASSSPTTVTFYSSTCTSAPLLGFPGAITDSVTYCASGTATQDGAVTDVSVTVTYTATISTGAWPCVLSSTFPTTVFMNGPVGVALNGHGFVVSPTAGDIGVTSQTFTGTYGGLATDLAGAGSVSFTSGLTFTFPATCPLSGTGYPIINVD
jgi:hypothetical protein